MSLGKSVRHDQKWAFLLEIDNFASAYFKSVSGYEAEVAVVVYNEGSVIAPEKAPGKVNFSNLTCERGVGVDEDAYLWFIDTADAAAGTGSDTPYRCLDLVQLSRAQRELGRTTFNDGFMTKYKGGEWDADASEVVIESMEIAYHHFDRQRGTT